jgi:P27 family predicted phage terminase small subunit
MSSVSTKSKTGPLIECPAELGVIARQEWDRVVPILAAADRLSELDRAALAIYCNAFAAWLEAITALRTDGTIVRSASGYPVQSPYVSIASKNAETVLKVSAQFGFTPAARMRLPNQIEDPFLLELRSVEDVASE